MPVTLSSRGRLISECTFFALVRVHAQTHLGERHVCSKHGRQKGAVRQGGR